MKKLAGCVFLCVLAFAVQLHGGDADATKPFQGTWRIVGFTSKGVDAPKEFIEKEDFRVTYTGRRYKVEKSDGSIVEEGAFAVDARAKPATIDLAIAGGKDKGKQVGIYRFDGETLTLCVARPNSARRPTAFATTAKDQQVILTMQRRRAKERSASQLR